MDQVNDAQALLGLQFRLNDQIDEISHLLQSFSEALENDRNHAEHVYHGRNRSDTDRLVNTWKALSARVGDSLAAMSQMKERITTLIVIPEDGWLAPICNEDG